MAKENSTYNTIWEPRFEFRTFGRDFNQAVTLMSKLTITVPEKVRRRKSEEIYIIPIENEINNVKIRDGKIDIKTLIQRVEELEQWQPLIKVKFPISFEVLENDVFPLLTKDLGRLENKMYSIIDFMNLVRKHSDIQAVSVEKERFGFMINDTICEYAKVWINKTMVTTINSESTVICDIKKTIKDIGLEGVENINYLQAVKRVTGMIDKKLAN